MSRMPKDLHKTPSERRQERETESAAGLVNRLQSTISEAERAKVDRDTTATREIRILTRDIKATKLRAERLTEELEEKTAQIEKLEDSLTADEPALSTEISELGSLQTNLEVAKKQIIILETKLANLQNRNKIIIDSLKSIKSEKATLEKAKNYDFSNVDPEEELDATLIIDGDHEANILAMEDKLLKLETDRDNLAGNLKATQLKEESLSESAIAGTEKTYETLDSLLSSHKRGQGGDLPTRVAAVVDKLKTLRETAKQNSLQVISSGVDSRERKIIGLTESLAESEAEINRLNDKVSVKVAKIHKLRDEISNQNSEIETLTLANSTNSLNLAQDQASNKQTDDAAREYEELFEAVALEKQKSSLLEARIEKVETERDEARLEASAIPSEPEIADSISTPATQSNVVSVKNKDAPSKMALVIAGLNKTIAELREENTELLLASMGI